jgi:hypothetical protein
MKQDEILQTLREVIAEAENFTTWTVSTPHLVELVKRAVEAEREAMVVEAAKKGWAMRGEDPFEDCVREIADIRARGQA